MPTNTKAGRSSPIFSQRFLHDPSDTGNRLFTASLIRWPNAATTCGGRSDDPRPETIAWAISSRVTLLAYSLHVARTQAGRVDGIGTSFANYVAADTWRQHARQWHGRNPLVLVANINPGFDSSVLFSASSDPQLLTSRRVRARGGVYDWTALILSVCPPKPRALWPDWPNSFDTTVRLHRRPTLSELQKRDSLLRVHNSINEWPRPSVSSRGRNRSLPDRRGASAGLSQRGTMDAIPRSLGASSKA